MAFRRPVQDFLLVVISIIIAFLTGALLQGSIGHWAAILSLVVLFSLLYGCARRRGWTAPFTLAVVGLPSLSELFLGLALITSTLGISWFLGVVISSTFSDMWGILAALCIFGVLMLGISASRNWQ